MTAAHAKPRRWLIALPTLAAVLLCVRPVSATWSIILVDFESREIGIGAATCLAGFDLRQALPVLRVDEGGACAQALVDSGANRALIWSQIIQDTDPAVILQLLEQQDPLHQSRQYGIVDVFGRAATFTGSSTIDYASGQTGKIGSIVYSVQGNILTGEPVISEAVNAILNTEGDIPEKLMAAMEAARAMGGDGRCSCSPANPTGCGSPPEEFEKSAHVGFMLDSRTGDAEGGCAGGTGCATGDYYMNFNVAFQFADDPDPVFQLQELFDAWRQDLIGRPDAVQSTWSLSKTTMPADSQSTAELSFSLKDWQGTPVTEGIQSVILQHDPESNVNSLLLGPVQDLGGGNYQATLTAFVIPGTALVRIRAHDGIRPVVLIPMPQLEITPLPGDINADGKFNFKDIDLFTKVLLGIDTGDPVHIERSDLDGNGTPNGLDMQPFIETLIN